MSDGNQSGRWWKPGQSRRTSPWSHGLLVGGTLVVGMSLVALGTLVAVAAPVTPAESPGSSPNGLRAPHPGGHMHSAFGHSLQPQLATTDSTGLFNCQKPANLHPTNMYHCYGPAQIRNAYSIQPLLDNGQDGSGRTITIIDAFQNPTMASDLASFDSRFGLPAPPSFKTIAPFGLTPFDPTDPNQVGWSSEIAIDVEWAHAVAPGAKIVLALSPDNADPIMVATQDYVINRGIGDVISMSYIDGEQCMNPAVQQLEHAEFNKANARGVTLFAASGDWGAAQYSCDSSSFIKAVGVPASDPDVTGVGGTELEADLTTGAYLNESVWNEPAYGAGGGGFSSLYARPAFQNGVEGVGSARGVPDVSGSASVNDGLVVAWGSSGNPGEFWVFGGTSIAAPQWAGIGAIADQSAGRDLGNINPALYALSLGANKGTTGFRDILTGNNDFAPISGYSAAHGWDAASGLGSPIASDLVAALVNK
jgi:subtilase family serine protease